MSHDYDLLVRRAWQGSHRPRRLDIDHFRRVEVQRDGNLLTGAESVAQGEAFVLTDGDLRDVSETAFWLELAVAGNCHYVDDHGGAQFLSAGVRVEQAGAIGSRMATAARDESTINNDGFSFHVAP